MELNTLSPYRRPVPQTRRRWHTHESTLCRWSIGTEKLKKKKYVKDTERAESERVLSPKVILVDSDYTKGARGFFSELVAS